MVLAQFDITDGTDRIPFISDTKSVTLGGWNPLNPSTDSSIWASSPFLGGRQKVSNRRDNVRESLTAVFAGDTEDSTILSQRKVYRMLEKAVAYWTEEFNTSPVWIEARGLCESKTRYAIIIDWRLPEDTDPNSPPLGSSGEPSSTEELTLELEHMTWLAIAPNVVRTDSDYCLLADSYQHDPGVAGRLWVSMIAVNADDCYVDTNAAALTAGSNDLKYGNAGVAFTYYEAGFRFQNIQVPQGSIIISAKLHWISDSALGAAPLNVQLNYEDEDNSAAWSTYANFIGRAWFNGGTFSVAIEVAGVAHSQDCTIPIQAIISRAGWAAGNAISLNLTDDGTSPVGEYRDAASKEEAAYMEPWLEITWADPDGTVRGWENDICSNITQLGTIPRHAPWAANVGKGPAQQINAVLIYDLSLDFYEAMPDSGGRCFPAVPGNGDYLLLGADVPFFNFTWDESNAPAGWTLRVRIWTGAAWTTVNKLILGDITSIPGNGRCVIHMEVGVAAWAKTTIMGQNKYWAIVEAQVAGAVNPLLNGWPFSLMWPWYSIDEDQIVSEIGSLIRTVQESHQYIGAFTNYRDWSFIALRSEDRCLDGAGGYDAEFTAHLNCYDGCPPPGCTVGSAGTADAALPWGGYLEVVMAGVTALTQVQGWEWVDGRAWIGKYHALLRCNITAGTPTDLLVQIQHRFQLAGNVVTEDIITGNESGEQVIDLGVIDLSTFMGTPEVKPGVLDIMLYIGSLAALTIRLYDIILVPADELIMESRVTNGTSHWSTDIYNPMYDGMIPKTRTEAWVYNDHVDYNVMVCVLQANILGELSIPRNKSWRLYYWNFDMSPNAGADPTGYLDTFMGRFWQNQRVMTFRGGE